MTEVSVPWPEAVDLESRYYWEITIPNPDDPYFPTKLVPVGFSVSSEEASGYRVLAISQYAKGKEQLRRFAGRISLEEDDVVAIRNDEKQEDDARVQGTVVAVRLDEDSGNWHLELCNWPAGGKPTEDWLREVVARKDPDMLLVVGEDKQTGKTRLYPHFVDYGHYDLTPEIHLYPQLSPQTVKQSNQHNSPLSAGTTGEKQRISPESDQLTSVVGKFLSYIEPGGAKKLKTELKQNAAGCQLTVRASRDTLRRMFGFTVQENAKKKLRKTTPFAYGFAPRGSNLKSPIQYTLQQPQTMSEFNQSAYPAVLDPTMYASDQAFPRSNGLLVGNDHAMFFSLYRGKRDYTVTIHSGAVHDFVSLFDTMVAYQDEAKKEQERT